AAGVAVGVGSEALAAGAAGAVVVLVAVAVGAVVADVAGDADCEAEAAGDAPGETGWLPPSMFGSLSILSARWLTTVTSLIALRMSASFRICCRWLMSASLILSRTPGSSSESGLVSNCLLVSLKMIQRPSGKCTGSLM